MSGDAEPKKPGTLQSLKQASLSWRTLSVSLMSFAAGVPLGLVWIAIPDWMRSIDVDIRVVGAFTLAQAPWSFKFLWSPLMDRFTPPWLGRRRGWALLAQVALSALILLLGGAGSQPDVLWVIGALALAIGFAAASHDIAIDAYAVEVLRRDEQGIAVGARTALYRVGMFFAGAAAITLAAWLSWPVVCIALALSYLPMLLITWKAPEPEEKQIAPSSLREAVWLPFVGALARHRALEILAFVVLYKLTDNLSQALLRPFLIDMTYSAVHRGFGFGLLGLWITLIGTFVGGASCEKLGLGRALWIFGGLQIFSNIGYVFITYAPGNLPLMYGALSFEMFSTGLGMGAFGVFLLRITQKRFSATQYALFSSLFGLPRILGGPITGLLVDAVGWRTFFWITIAAGIPGLLFLQRFAPLGVREPNFDVEAPKLGRGFDRGELALLACVGGVAGFVLSALGWAVLMAAKAFRATPEIGFDVILAIRELTAPKATGDWLEIVGLLSVGAIFALFTAAIAAARSAGSGEAGSA